MIKGTKSARVSLIFMAVVTAGFVNVSADKKIVYQGPITFKEIGDTYISSFGVVDTPKSSSPAPTEIDSSKKLILELPDLPQHEKRQKLFSLFAQKENVETPVSALTVDALRAMFKDLDIFYGSGAHSSDHFMNIINQCNTIFGEAALAHMLSRPEVALKGTGVSNACVVRQEFIKELIQNEALFNEVDALLKKVKAVESGFFSFWREDDPVSKEFFKALYFKRMGLANLNKNQYVLEAGVRMGNLGTAYTMSSDLLMLFGINYAMLKANQMMASNVARQDSLKSPAIEAAKVTLEILKGFLDPREFIKQYTEIAPLAVDAMEKGRIEQGIDAFTPAGRDSVLKMTYAAFAIKDLCKVGYLGIKGWIVKNALAEAQQTRDAINYLQTRLIDVAIVTKTCSQLSQVATTHPAMKNGLHYLGNIDVLLNQKTNANLASLIAQLQTNTFAGKASFFSFSGRVLSSFKLMNEEKDNFAPAILALGEIDACLSVAKLYKKMQGKRVGYCFVAFTQDEKPSISITDFWNPFINPDSVVTNSLELGKEHRNIILTGSNTGGKSTILKALMINLLLAQTFGVAAAKEMTLTPFAYLGSYLRVADDIAAGDSLFQAEVNRAKLLLDTLNSLDKKQFGFLVIDELFTGTSAQKGEKAAYNVAKELAEKYPNALTVVATHFPLLTTLPNELPSIAANYKVDIYKDADGKLVRPFKLEKGISTSNVADDILHAALNGVAGN